jgi:hypothetical protein
MSQSHYTLSFPLQSPADAKMLAEQLPPMMPGLDPRAHLNKKLRFCITPYPTAFYMVVHASVRMTGETAHRAVEGYREGLGVEENRQRARIPTVLQY